jgi:hypothetical protein
MTGGLDMLETIGKKTYNVIAEGDHGLKNTLQSNRQKTSLAQVSLFCAKRFFTNTCFLADVARS